MVPSWIIYTLATMLAWGCWGFFSALGKRHLPEKVVFMWHCISIVVCATLGLPFCDLALPSSQIAFSMLGGIGYAQGAVWMVDSLAAGGQAGIVVIVTSMYPIVVLVLNRVFLGQVLSFFHCMGVVLATGAIFCFLEKVDVDEDCGPHDGEVAILVHDPRPHEETIHPTLAPCGSEAAVTCTSVPSEHRNQRQPLKWLGLCFLASVGFAVWAFMGELCERQQTPGPLVATVQVSRLIWQAFGCACVCALQLSLNTCGRHSAYETPLLLDIGGGKPTEDENKSFDVMHHVGIWSSLAMGLSMVVGAAAFMLALQKAPAQSNAAVVMITGMYGVVTQMLTRLLLKEKLSWTRLGGIVLALGACALLS